MPYHRSEATDQTPVMSRGYLAAQRHKRYGYPTAKCVTGIGGECGCGVCEDDSELDVPRVLAAIERSISRHDAAARRTPARAPVPTGTPDAARICRALETAAARHEKAASRRPGAADRLRLMKWFNQELQKKLARISRTLG